MSNNKLCGGSIFQAVRLVACSRASDDKKRRVIVEEGELCEFRYQRDAHFRVMANDGTNDDLYLYLTESDFLYNFKYVGKVFEQVRFRNNNSMKEIIDARLYEVEK